MRVRFAHVLHEKIEKLEADLAEQHKALRKISGLLQHQLDNEDSGDLITILQLLDTLMIIAKNACKGKYRGPKHKPILPVSLKCKCGYELKSQDKSCLNCDKLFGKED